MVLVTGGCGFIGANFIRWMLPRDPAVRIVNVDALTYSGNPANLVEVEAEHATRYRFVHGDIADADLVSRVLAEEAVDTIVHLAAESHVDRSIESPDAFVHSNVLGTYVLLAAARAAWRGRQDVRFHHVSTDEVFGSLGLTGYFSETTAYDPSSPYRPRRRHPITWCAPGIEPSACRSRFRTARTTTDRTSFPEN